LGLLRLERVKRKTYGHCGKTLLRKIRKACQVAGLLFWLDDSLKSDFEVCGFRVWSYFFYFALSYVAGKGVLYFPDAVVYIFIRALGKHLDSSVNAVADKAG
jgi:hypothetical protein